MKKNKIIYWLVTGSVTMGFLMSSLMYLTKSPALTQGFQTLNLPDYFIPLLGFAKLFGAIALINPWFPKLKEWAYAGFTFMLIGASWLHVSTGTNFLAPLIFLALLALSYYFNLKFQPFKKESPSLAV